uniref:Class II aldolase/adducin family protein n=1 Tax=candidate division WOR-3 bacterium TaxID=2052148 RepID=A0A7V3ZYS9_UNCW3
MLSYQSEREEIIRVLKILYEKDFIQANVGNVSVKVTENEILITPRGKRKAELNPEDILVVDMNGNVIEGTLDPSIELKTHLAWYRVKPGIGAIIHAHPPYTTAVSFYTPVESKPLMAELSDYLGLKLISIPYKKAGSAELEEEVSDKGALEGVYILILQKHGVLVAGKNLMDALNRLELLEFDMKIKVLKELVI